MRKPQLHPSLQIKSVQRADNYVVRLSGDLDMNACPVVELALEEAEMSQAWTILLDLDRLTFADAAGLSLLLRAGRRSVCNGNRLRMTRGSGQVAAMFELTALDMTLPFADPPHGSRTA
jgi:anti-anti-sigma factor